MQDFYRAYLAADLAVKRLESLGYSVERAVLPSTGKENAGYWRNMLERQLDAGKVPDLYRFGEIQIYLPSFDDWSLPREERERDAQKKREELILKFIAAFPDAVCARHGGEASLYFEVGYAPLGVTINVGQALCERVQVGTRTVSQPDPEALAALPRIEVEEPVFEWYCNDAELGVNR